MSQGWAQRQRRTKLLWDEIQVGCTPVGCSSQSKMLIELVPVALSRRILYASGYVTLQKEQKAKLH